ncbi:hypothetical protein pEaSNUABM14_00246 [Erwinia phage pEa_SNUABM_14]|uniref:Uncharacterized protein n=1 Tax=Erwinia phage pEa_SNUABM_7 TaxID=2866695 RepID=A0AAE8BKQ6_9CAUD|nr:hypothetical protein MPK74_gp247 [Erwinia phage pEa_SNUABM_7]QYW04571.1 hypothetical protein pEaSNUABM14_00246 [Erwinia phage pEa_SNUABM_14]QYW04915.1 hypothetical protein pEaSNUABM7_00247 [Erwinia phage pEa_SNUABM_7]
MRTLIHTADVTNLSVLELEEGSVAKPVTPNLISDLKELLSRENLSQNIRHVVFISADQVGVFTEAEMINYFDPIEQVSEINAGNIGTVLAMQVIRVDDKTNLIAVAGVTDVEEGVTINEFNASPVNL